MYVICDTCSVDECPPYVTACACITVHVTGHVPESVGMQQYHNRPVGSKFEMVRPNYSAKLVHNDVMAHAHLPSRPHAAQYARMIMLSNCFLGRFDAVVAES